jgi:hypothetical protein
VCKNSPPLEPIHHREKLKEAERKLPVVLFKPEDHRRTPTPSAEFLRRKPPPSALHAAHSRWKVS